MARTVHTIKVTLRGVKPPVWRRIEVASEITLYELAANLAGVMGWLDYHLHLFDIDGQIYDLHHPELEALGLDETRHRVGDVMPRAGMRARWEYDFGDGWEHDLLVEGIRLRKPSMDLPVCLAGRRACPPEDCGGPWGYAEYLEALADPSHPEHETFTNWAPDGFDPAAFDLAASTGALRDALRLRREAAGGGF